MGEESGDGLIIPSTELDPETGRLCKVGRPAQAVYMVLVCHANQKTRIAWPSHDTIAASLGCGIKVVERAVGDLQKQGLIEVLKRGGGRTKTGKGISNRYKITPPYPVRNDGVEGGATPSEMTDNPVTFDQRTPSEMTGEQVREQVIEQQQGAAAGIDDSSDPNRQALTLAGVGDPARSDLADLPGITPTLIRDKAAWCRERGKGVPVLIEELKLASEQHIERERRRRDQQETIPAPKPAEPVISDEERQAGLAGMRAALRAKRNITAFPNASRGAKGGSTEFAGVGAIAGPS